MISYEELSSMQLIRFFMVDKGYRPVVVKTSKNEIFLERMDDANVQLIRITPEPIVFADQVNQDELRIKNIAKQIKKKSFSSKIISINIYTADVDFSTVTEKKHIKSVSIRSANKDEKYLIDFFPDAFKAIQPVEDPDKELQKITAEISQNNAIEAKKHSKFSKESIFPMHRLFIMLSVFSFMLIAIISSNPENYSFEQILITYGAVHKPTLYSLSQWWRPLVGPFLSIGLFELFISVWLIYKIGKITENFYGTIKFTIISVLGMFAGAFAVMAYDGIALMRGPTPMIGAWLGALMAFGISNKNIMVKHLKPLLLPVLIFSMSVLWYGPHEFAYAFSGLATGLFAARVVAWKGKGISVKSWFDLIVVVGIIVAPIAIIEYKGLNYTEYENYDVDDLNAYREIGKNPDDIGIEICVYYEVKEEDCLWG